VRPKGVGALVVSALVSGGVAVLRTPPPSRKQRTLDALTAAEEAAQYAAAKRRAALVRCRKRHVSRLLTSRA
jgi:hypothetical protein